MQAAFPHLIRIHCISHRVALCMWPVIQAVPELMEAEATVQKVYNHFANSATRCASLQAIQAELEEPQTKLQGIHAVRWFSRSSAVNAVAKSQDSLAEYFSQKQGLQDCPGAREKFSAYRFRTVLAYTADLLRVMRRISLASQQEAVDICGFNRELASAKTCVADLATQPGAAERFFSGKPRFSEAVQGGQDGFVILRDGEPDFVDFKRKVGAAVVEQLEPRFPGAPTISNFTVFRPQSMPGGHRELSSFGDVEIASLRAQFRTFCSLDEFDVAHSGPGTRKWSRRTIRTKICARRSGESC